MIFMHINFVFYMSKKWSLFPGLPDCLIIPDFEKKLYLEWIYSLQMDGMHA